MAKGDKSQAQNMVNQDRSTYFGQQQPVLGNMTNYWNNSAGTNTGDYNDIMNRYRGFLDNTGGAGAGGSGGGTTSAGYTDPFNSYAGYQDFSKTGGYSPDNIANMRARSVAPIRASYANAERELNRNRALQGGYSPNFAAASAKMAREQGQAGADAMQNTEAGLGQMVQQGRLAGLAGMSDIEKARLQADLQTSMFNAGSSNSASSQSAADQLRALGGMTSMYGTTPGMANMFGDQMINLLGQGGQYGLGSQQGYYNASKLPGAWDTTMGRIGDIGNMAAGIAYPWM